jgi:small-conductance mechanosensitive channel
MNWAGEYIKKLMSWCPNVKTLETESRISSANFKLYDQSGGEKARNPGISSRFSKLFSRYDIRILLPTLFLTLVYINLLFQKGINAEALFLGFSLSLLIYLLGWKKQMHHYDSLAKKPIFGSSSKKILLWVFLVLILFLILPIVFLSQLPSFLNARLLYSLVAGAGTIMWGSCLQLIYWEKKNHMKIYIKYEKGLQKMYAIGEKEGEL